MAPFELHIHFSHSPPSLFLLETFQHSSGAIVTPAGMMGRCDRMTHQVTHHVTHHMTHVTHQMTHHMTHQVTHVVHRTGSDFVLQQVAHV